MKTLFLYIGVLIALAGCSTNNRNICIVEYTRFDITVTYNPQTQLPEGNVGYARGIFCIIPTGLNTEPGNTGGSAKDVPPVMLQQAAKGSLMGGVEIDNRLIVGTPDSAQITAATALFSR